MGDYSFLTEAKPRVLENQIPSTENMKKGRKKNPYRKCFSPARSLAESLAFIQTTNEMVKEDMMRENVFFLTNSP